MSPTKNQNQNSNYDIINIIAKRDNKMIKTLQNQLEISNDIIDDLVNYVARLEARIKVLEPVEVEVIEPVKKVKKVKKVKEIDNFIFKLNEEVRIYNYFGLIGTIKARKIDSDGDNVYTVMYFNENNSTGDFKEDQLTSYNMEDEINEAVENLIEDYGEEEYDIDDLYVMVKDEIIRQQEKNYDELDEFLHPEKKLIREEVERQQDIIDKQKRKQHSKETKKRITEIKKQRAIEEAEAEKAIKEPVKKEPVKKEPVKKEPVKKEPVKKEPVKKAPIKKEPIKKAPVKKAKKPENIYNTGHNMDEDEQDRLDAIAHREAERLEHIQYQKEFDEREKKEIAKINKKIAKNNKTAQKIINFV